MPFPLGETICIVGSSRFAIPLHLLTLLFSWQWFSAH